MRWSPRGGNSTIDTEDSPEILEQPTAISGEIAAHVQHLDAQPPSGIGIAKDLRRQASDPRVEEDALAALGVRQEVHPSGTATALGPGARFRA